MTGQIPLVSYLVLDDGGPRLRAIACRACGARFFDRRNACSRCFGDTFDTALLAERGSLRSFTIVHRAAPGLPTPYISAVVDLDGGGVVKANLLEVAPEPDDIELGMAVRLAIYVAGTDDDGTEAIGFGFVPDGNGRGEEERS
ncbi:MAG: Zn-ribbon domain-containing OB-fold protein [Acidimicrobiia bacterium]